MISSFTITKVVRSINKLILSLLSYSFTPISTLTKKFSNLETRASPLSQKAAKSDGIKEVVKKKNSPDPEVPERDSNSR